MMQSISYLPRLEVWLGRASGCLTRTGTSPALTVIVQIDLLYRMRQTCY